MAASLRVCGPVVANHEITEFGDKRSEVARRCERQLSVERERCEPLIARGSATHQGADVVHRTGRRRCEVFGGELIGTGGCRIPVEQERVNQDPIRDRLEDPFGQAAAPPLGHEPYQADPFQLAHVVVDLLPWQLEFSSETGRRMRGLEQREYPPSQRAQRRRNGVGVLEYDDRVHTVILILTNRTVK